MGDSTLLDADLKDNRGVVKLESQASSRPALLNDERAAGSSLSHSKHGRLSLPAGDDEEAQRLLPPSQRQRHRIDPQSRRYWPHQQPASTCASSPYFSHKIAGFSIRLILLLLLLLMIGVAFQFTNRTCLSSASVNQRAPTTDDLHHPLPIRRGPGAPVDRLIDFSGRWVQNNVTNGYTTGWSGSSARIMFYGSRLDWTPGPLTQSKAGKTRTVAWSLNGTEAGGVYIKNYDPITLIDNPSPGLYVVAIWLTDYESFLDLGHFTTSADGGFAPPPPRANDGVRLTFIGDSVTTGLKASGSVSEVDSFNVYAALIARRLDAPLNLVSFPGITLRDDPDRGKGMMTRYEWADPGHTADPYNASLDRPTHIFINIGVNDQYMNQTAEGFVGTLETFLDRLIVLHQDTNPRIYVVDPFGWFLPNPAAGGTLTRLAVWSPEVAYLVRTKFAGPDGRHPRVRFIDTDGWLSSEFTQDGLHPTVAGNVKVADRLEAFLM